MQTTTNPAEWLALGAVLYLLPEDPLGPASTFYQMLEDDALPMMRELGAQLPLTHKLVCVLWPDGTGICYARRTTLPPVSAAWLEEQHAEARLRHSERHPRRLHLVQPA